MGSVATTSLWQECVTCLENEIPASEFNTWIRPLQAELANNKLRLLAPNRFVLDWINERFLSRIKDLVNALSPEILIQISLEIGSAQANNPPLPVSTHTPKDISTSMSTSLLALKNNKFNHLPNNLNTSFTFANFIEGKSNALARAASLQVGENPGKAYNPLFLYGEVGLGKTHLMHAAGNLIKANNPSASILYLHSERFVADMVKALQHNDMEEFKRFYRSINFLLMDDIQFFAGKGRSQEEFFHTFNALLDNQQQIILTSDHHPKELDGLEERLKSRFGWGLTIGISPPELETRVAILVNKAEQSNVKLPQEVAFFIAKRVKSNVRELEGALKRVIANAHFTGSSITLDFANEALKDLLTLQAKLITIENIQKNVAKYYKMKISDLLSKRRNRTITRPRQMAMALAKELTSHSLPEIGEAFGGRDHTTVLHACRKIKELLLEHTGLKEDYDNLLRILST